MLISTENVQDKVEKTAKLVDQGSIEEAVETSGELSSYRLAKVLREAEEEMVIPVLKALEASRAARVVANFPEEMTGEVLEKLEFGEVKRIIKYLSSDRIIDLLPHLNSELKENILASLSVKEKKAIESLSSYPEGTVGAVMKPSCLTVEKGTTIEEAAKEKSEEIVNDDYLYVIDKEEKLVGVLSLRELMTAGRKKRVEDVMKRNVVTARAFDDDEEAASTLRARRLKLLPVVDEEDILLGVLTMNSALKVLSDELAEDFVAVSGASAEESFFTAPKDAIKMRLPWMVGNVFLNLAAVTIISSFEATIEQVAILAAFLPMITDMGGNVGIQALSVSIRSIALGEVQLRDFWRAIRKELTVGAFNGLFLGCLFAAVAVFLEGNLILGAVAGTALALNVLLAGVVGGTLPFIIKHFGKDPALMTGPILTTVTDITGVTVYLTLSTIFLLQLLG